MCLLNLACLPCREIKLTHTQTHIYLKECVLKWSYIVNIDHDSTWFMQGTALQYWLCKLRTLSAYGLIYA